MSDVDVRLPQHGRDHRTGGSDPIPGLDGIRFDVDNEGGYLQVVANDHIPASDTSIELTANLDGLGAGGDIEITAANDIGLTATAQITNSAPVVATSSAAATVEVDATGAEVLLASGKTFTVFDHLNVALITFTG